MKGRIWVIWSSQVRVTPIFKSDQIVTVSVLLEGEEEEFFCSFVYAENTIEKEESYGGISSLIKIFKCSETRNGLLWEILMRCWMGKNIQIIRIPV